MQIDLRKQYYDVLFSRLESELFYIQLRIEEAKQSPASKDAMIEIIHNDVLMILDYVRKELGQHEGLTGPV